MFMHLLGTCKIGDAIVRDSAGELLAVSESKIAISRRRSPHVAARFLLDYFFQ